MGSDCDKRAVAKMVLALFGFCALMFPVSFIGYYFKTSFIFLSYLRDDDTVDFEYRDDIPADAVPLALVQYNLRGTVKVIKVEKGLDFDSNAGPMLDEVLHAVHPWRRVLGTKELIAEAPWYDKQLVDFLERRGWKRHRNGKMFYPL